MKRFGCFSDIADYLHSLGLFHMDMGLGRMERGLEALGLRRPPFPVLQLVGTNGKGSTASFVSAIARAHGMRVGLYTSPHFVAINERIRIDGRPLDEELWPDLANEVYAAAPDATYFEFLTLLAVLAFARAGVEFAVMEAGLGGRYDATSAVDADMLCVTAVALDHEDVLGHSLQAIARDKAGALRAAVPLLSAPQEACVLEILQAAAEAQGALFLVVNPTECDTVRLGLAGAHQRVNAALAVLTWHTLCERQGWPCSVARVEQGLARTFIAGRLQYIPANTQHPCLILDGAHNPHGLRACCLAMEAAAAMDANMRPQAVIFSCLADKKWDEMLPLAARMARDVPLFLVPIRDNPRSAPIAVLAKALSAVHGDVRCADSLPAVFKMLTPTENPVMICGSLYLLAEFFTLWPEYLTEASIL